MSRPSPVAPSAPLTYELLPGLSAWEACCSLAGSRHLLFLDSALPSALGRYSFVTADPAEWLMPDAGNPFDALASKLASWQAETVAGLPPFQGGAAGLFGYDLC